MSEADLEACFNRISISSETTQTTNPRQLKEIFDAVCLLQQEDFETRLRGMKSLRVVTTETPPPIDAIIDSGITPVVIHFLQPKGVDSNAWEMVWEASWVMLNLLSGDELQVIKLLDRENTVTQLLQLLNNLDVPLNVKDHACWAVGNIAGTGAKYRDMLLQEGAVAGAMCFWEQLQELENFESAQKFAQTVSWTLGNLSKLFFGPVEVTPFVPFVRSLCIGLNYRMRPEVADDFATVCLQLVEACADFADLIVLNNGVAYVDQQCTLLCQIGITGRNAKGMLGLLGSLAATNDRVTQAFCIPSAIRLLIAVASDPSTGKCREMALWALSNFSATTDCVGNLVSSGVLDVCLSCLQQLDALWVVTAREAVLVATNVVIVAVEAEQLLNIFPPFIAEIYAVFKTFSDPAKKAQLTSMFEKNLLERFCRVCDIFVRCVANGVQEMMLRSQISQDELQNVVVPFLFSPDAVIFCEQVAPLVNESPESKPSLDALWDDIAVGSNLLASEGNINWEASKF